MHIGKLIVKYLFIALLGYSVLFMFSIKLIALYLYINHPAQLQDWREKALVYAGRELQSPPVLAATQQTQRQNIDQLITAELNSLFPVWQALPGTDLTGVWLDGVQYSSLQAAAARITDNSHLKIGSGVYRSPLLIRHHNVVIEGIGHVVFEAAAVAGKGFILAVGDNLTVKNIECRYIRVASKNGVCIRLEGRGLNLEHVYFHSSEGALLETAKQHGYINISNSRFENLAQDARSHSIYLNSASLYLQNSSILANRHQHSLKSRGPLTIIENSIIAELSAPGSRLIDLSNGGELIIKGSLLQQGPNAVNNQAIGFGLEGLKYQTNQISITDSLVLLERQRSNFLLHSGQHPPQLHIENNLIIAADDNFPHNQQLSNRQAAKLAPYPVLPVMLCHLQRCAKP